MRKLLGLLAAVAAASALLALSAGQAFANHVHCGDVITQDTTLDSDLNCPGDGLIIGANNVTLDLNGHTISGQGPGEGVSVLPPPPAVDTWHNIEVRGGVVSNVGVSMSRVEGAVVSDLNLRGGDVNCREAKCTIEHNRVTGPYSGIFVSRSTADANVDHNVVVGGVIVFGKGAGGSISDNFIKDAADGNGIDVVHAEAAVTRNVIRDSGNAGIAVGSGHAEIVDNKIYGSAASGIAISTYGGATISGNTVNANGEHGIAMPSLTAATITHNVISGNRLDGVHAIHDLDWGGPHPQVSDNRVDRNGEDGIHTDSGATLSRNHTWFNGNLGIEAVPGTLGGDNWAKHNGNPPQCVPRTLCSTTGKPRG